MHELIPFAPNPSTLTQRVRQAMGSQSIAINDWRSQALTNELGSGCSVYRLTGTGNDHGVPRPWSLIVKIIVAPNAIQGHLPLPVGRNLDDYNFWRREPFAYASGLLDRLPDSVCAPRCFGIDEYDDHAVWLWLEDAGIRTGVTWSLAEFRQVAYDLGRFNGAYLVGRPLPGDAWLSENWFPGWLARWTFLPDLLRQLDGCEQAFAEEVCPAAVRERVLALWDEREVFLRALHCLPQTLCHRDANCSNLFVKLDANNQGRTLAVDWALIGRGSLGEEIAQLVASSLIRGCFPAVDAPQLDAAVFAAYCSGLRTAGWQGDFQIVRLGYTAAAALRWGVAGLFGLVYALVPGQQAEAERRFGSTIETLFSRWTATACFLLDLADEARSLMPRFARTTAGLP